MAEVWNIFTPLLKELVTRGSITETGLRVPPITNPDDVADIVSQTLLIALEDKQRLAYDGKRPFLNYLAKIARNRYVSDYRKYGRERLAVGRDDDDVVDFTLGDGPAEPDKSPVDPEARAVIEKFLAKQPERIRALFLARHLHDLSEREAADRLGISRTRLCQLEDRMLEELRVLLARAGVRSSADRLTPSPGERTHG